MFKIISSPQEQYYKYYEEEYIKTKINIDYCLRWLAEFEDICEVLEIIKQGNIDRIPYLREELRKQRKENNV